MYNWGATTLWIDTIMVPSLLLQAGDEQALFLCTTRDFKVHAGSFLAMTRQAYPSRILPLRLQTFVEVVQPVVADLHTDAVSLGVIEF